MENYLLKKLQIKAGFKVKVIHAPANFPNIIGNYANVDFLLDDIKKFDALLIFAITKADMKQALVENEIIFNHKMISWILYPKAKTKLASDLNLMQSWDDLKNFKLTPCASAAIDEIWTAIRIKPESATKRSGQGNAQIKENDYGNYIDVKNKIVTIPPDLKTELQKHIIALTYFEQLAYSHKKEYVIWILSAKQEKTRIDRIQKTVEKLLDKKKNPTEK